MKNKRLHPDFWDAVDGLIPLGILLFVILTGYAAHRNALKHQPPAPYADQR